MRKPGLYQIYRYRKEVFYTGRPVISRLSEQDCVQYRDEVSFIEVANDFDVWNLDSLPVKKQNSGRAKELETFE